MKAPIHSRKHIVQLSLFNVTTGVTVAKRVIDAVAIQDVTVNTEVSEGAIVKAIFVELWTLNSANDGFEITVFSKTNDNTDGPSHTEMLLLDSYPQKKNILHIHEGLSANDGVGNPINVYRGWIKIPKGKQRFGLGDRFVISVANPGPNTMDVCGMVIYKEYT